MLFVTHSAAHCVPVIDFGEQGLVVAQVVEVGHAPVPVVMLVSHFSLPVTAPSPHTSVPQSGSVAGVAPLGQQLSFPLSGIVIVVTTHSA